MVSDRLPRQTVRPRLGRAPSLGTSYVSMSAGSEVQDSRCGPTGLLGARCPPKASTGRRGRGRRGTGRRALHRAGDAGADRRHARRAAVAHGHATGEAGRSREILGALAAGYAQALRGAYLDRAGGDPRRGAACAGRSRAEARCGPARPGSGRSSPARRSASASATVDGRSSRSTGPCATCSATPPTSCSRLNVRRLHPPDDDPEVWDKFGAAAELRRDRPLPRARSAYYRQGRRRGLDRSGRLAHPRPGRPSPVRGRRWSRTSPSGTSCRRGCATRPLHDPLTGLPNRTLFFDRLGDALRTSRPGARGRRLLPRPRRLQGRSTTRSATTSATSCC